MEERLKRRKLDALKRGVHRVTGGEALSMATHVVGIGRAGAGVVAETLRRLEPAAPKLNALVIDVGDQDFAELRSLAQSIPPERAAITIAALDVPTPDDLLDVLRQYPRFLSLEYPSYRHDPKYAAWLPDFISLPKAGSHFRRAVAKAIYGAAYYSGPRLLETVLRDFASGVDAANAQSVVAIVFGLGGGTGSGIAADLARHLSNRMFGRRVLVAGIGIAPCDGDPAEHTGGHLFPILNELDCMGDDSKNRGVVQSCGELFRNPYTAGFIMVPQQHMWNASNDLAATHRRGNSEIASLLTIKGGAHLWELLRLLNWVAAPSTQHSAARTPWGPRWIHLLGYADLAGQPIAIGPDLPTQLGVTRNFRPEFIEMRVPDTTDANAAVAASKLKEVFAPDVPPSIVGGGRENSIQFILPCISKLDLGLFYKSRAAYEVTSSSERLLDHSLLLDQGVVLCEPSTRMAGMAGQSLPGGNGWIAVPMIDLQGAMSHAT
jgi:hypothetical protein